MKLILTREVGNLGGPGDIVEVRDGYGRNYLVPRGHAIPWSRGAEKQIGTIRRAREVREVRDVSQARALATGLAALPVQLPRRAGRSGRLFGSVSAGDIVAAVQAAGGPNLDKRRMDVPAPIRTLGDHQVTVRLHPEVTATVTVQVVAEE